MSVSECYGGCFLFVSRVRSSEYQATKLLNSQLCKLMKSRVCVCIKVMLFCKCVARISELREAQIRKFVLFASILNKSRQKSSFVRRKRPLSVVLFFGTTCVCVSANSEKSWS